MQIILLPNKSMEKGGLLSGQKDLFQRNLERVKCGEADTHSNGPLDPVHGETLVQAMAHAFLPAPNTMVRCFSEG